MAQLTPEQIKELRNAKTAERKQQVKTTAANNSRIDVPPEAGSALTLVSQQSHANGVQFVKQVAEASFAKGVEDGVAAYFALTPEQMMNAMFPSGLPQISGDVEFTVTPLLLPEGERFPEPNT